MSDKPRRKQYVKVVAIHLLDGSIEPKIIMLTNGPAFIVESVKAVTQVHPENTTKLFNRYTVVIRDKETYLYEECGKWYVQMKS